MHERLEAEHGPIFDFRPAQLNRAAMMNVLVWREQGGKVLKRKRTHRPEEVRRRSRTG